MGDDVTVGFESITVKRDLGTSLKAARSAAKISATRAAEMVGISQASVSRIESGKQTVNEDQLRSMARAYGVDRAELSRWVGMLIRVNAPDRWWHEEPYRGFLSKRYAELIGVEDAAETLLLLQLQVVPGLLATPEYTRALLEGSPLNLSPEEVDARVEIRQIRQRRLGLGTARSLRATFILSQAVLEMCYSSEGIHRDQMRHLDRLVAQENVTIAILPFDRMIDLHSADLYDLPGGANPVVFVESLVANAMVHTSDEVERIRISMLKAQQNALSPAQSRVAIRQRMDGYKYVQQQQ